MTEHKENCDQETGVCYPQPLHEGNTEEKTTSESLEVIYVGDPMCSWCYGIAPELDKLKSYCESEEI